MRFKTSTQPWPESDADLICLPVNRIGKKDDRGFRGKPVLLPQEARKVVRWAIRDFDANAGDSLLLYPRGGLDRLLLVGLGRKSRSRREEAERLRLAGGHIAARARELRARTVSVLMPSVELGPGRTAQALAEGLILGNYRFERYKEKSGKKGKNTTGLRRCLVHIPAEEATETRLRKIRRGLRRGRILARAVCRARDMAHEPGSVWTPESFAAHGRHLARRYGITCTVLGRSELEDLGMGGILAVNRGSASEPRLVILERRVGEDLPTVMLVGKGLTFDSGGISLKPARGMEDMKFDMCGGAAVMQAMEAVCGLDIGRVNLVALVPSTDNMPGGSALKPGDVVRHYGGTTTEVLNTDAEGRLILADALAYGAETFKPEAVIDLATLTGAVITALGHHHSGLMANDRRLARRIIRAGRRAGEPVWQLPLGPDYEQQIESRIADVKNMGDAAAGTITAACFLQKFVGKTPWAHLDIAGTAWNFTEKSYVPQGPSGIGVRTLVELLRTWKPLGSGKDGKGPGA